MNYRMKPREVEAVKFVGNPEELFEWARKLTPENSETEVVMVCALDHEFESIPVGIEIISERYQLTLKPGDYLVFTEGNFTCIDPTLFENFYEEVK